MRALRQVQHPSIRPLAIELMDVPNKASDGVALLSKNFLPGDENLIAASLDRQTGDDEFHWVGHSALNVFEANPDADPVDTMMPLYERTACSLCRKGAVKLLKTKNRLPEWMVSECLYDSNLDLREWMAAENSHPSPPPCGPILPQ